MTGGQMTGGQQVLIALVVTATMVAGGAPAAMSSCKKPLATPDRLQKAGAQQTFTIPSSSSFPTVQRGESVETARVTAGFQPRIGDLVVYASPTQKQVTYLKRIVAVGPTTVQMRNGRLFVGGKQIARTGPLPWNSDGTPAGLVEAAKAQCRGPAAQRTAAKLYRETLADGVSYRIAECSDTQRGTDNTAVIKVPAGHYFVLGDNRDKSIDSRFQGPVPASWITHIATCVQTATGSLIPTIIMVLHIALWVLVAVLLGLLLFFWRRRRARDTA